MNLTLVSTIMEDTYDRVKSGIYYDVNLKPYSKEFLVKVMKFFQDKERYEECLVIQNIIKIRFDHDNEFNFRELPTPGTN